MPRHIAEGELIPWGWAIAYRDFNSEFKVAYPIPLHLVVRWGRDLRYWLMRVGRPGFREAHELTIYRKGREDEAQMAVRYIAAQKAEWQREARAKFYDDILADLDSRSKRKA